jgi:hypothetical protein
MLKRKTKKKKIKKTTKKTWIKLNLVTRDYGQQRHRKKRKIKIRSQKPISNKSNAER